MAAKELTPEQLDDLWGARIEHVEVRADGRIELEFAHKGTDDGSGFLIVAPHDVQFTEPR